MLVKYGAGDLEPVDTQIKAEAPPLEPWDRTASDQGALMYTMFMGALTWLTRFNPRLAFGAQDLAHFSHNPVPFHVAAAFVELIRC